MVGREKKKELKFNFSKKRPVWSVGTEDTVCLHDVTISWPTEFAFCQHVFSELQMELACTQTGISLLEDCRVAHTNKTLNFSVVFLSPCTTKSHMTNVILHDDRTVTSSKQIEQTR